MGTSSLISLSMILSVFCILTLQNYWTMVLASPDEPIPTRLECFDSWQLCNPQKSISPRDSWGSRFASCIIIDSILTKSLFTESVLLFLPAYSPDFNPIEESLSAGKWFINPQIICDNNLKILTVKAWIQRNWRCMMDSDTPELDLLEACGCVTAARLKAGFIIQAMHNYISHISVQ